jgi:Domain of unknown function (DUF4350)
MMAIIRHYSAWLWLALAMLAIGVVDAVSQRGPQPAPALSANGTAGNGALALHLWLERIGNRVDVSSSDSDPCAALRPGPDVLLVLRDGADIPAGAQASCLSWARRGGRIVVATTGSTAVPLLDSLGIRVVPAPVGNVSIVQPVLLSPPVTELSGQAGAVVSTGPPFVTAAATGSGAAIVRVPVGSGDLWLLTAPELLSNQNLNQADNAALVLNLVPPGGRVLLEQYAGPSAAAGSARGDWLGAGVWGLAVIFVFFLLLAYRGLTGIRLGPAVRPLAETHRPASEFVFSMAGTLADARKRVDLLRQYQSWLRRSLRERHVDSSPTEAGRLLMAEASPMLTDTERLSDTELLKRVQAMVRFGERLERTRV